MKHSQINIEVVTDENHIPDQINWKASAAVEDNMQAAKAMIISFWDGEEKTALRIDLWTKSMMMDEMADFIYQTMMTMADTFGRATNYTDMVKDMKDYSAKFLNRFKEKQLEENKAG